MYVRAVEPRRTKMEAFRQRQDGLSLKVVQMGREKEERGGGEGKNASLSFYRKSFPSFCQLDSSGGWKDKKKRKRERERGSNGLNTSATLEYKGRMYVYHSLPTAFISPFARQTQKVESLFCQYNGAHFLSFLLLLLFQSAPSLLCCRPAAPPTSTRSAYPSRTSSATSASWRLAGRRTS